MDSSSKKIIREDILDILMDNIEEFFVMGRYCLYTYIRCLYTFGKDSKVTLDVRNVWIEFLSIIKEEKRLLDIIKRNLKILDYERIDEFIFQLDELNENTILYYFNVLDNILCACDLNREWKANRDKKNFDTLIDTFEYRKKICEFSLDIEDVINFFGYPDSFWNYLEDRFFVLDGSLEENREFYGVNLKMKGNILEDIKVFVPGINDLDTALINVHEFKHAYDLYKLLGKKVLDDDSLYEMDAKNMEMKFKNEYMPLVYKRVLGKK